MIRFIIISLLVYSPLAFSAKKSAGRIFKFLGTATITSGSKIHPAKTGEKVYLKDIIETQAGSIVVIKLKDTSKLKVNENSKITINNPRTKGIELQAGSLFVKVNPNRKKKQIFKIKTRSAVAGVRGTEFFTSYGTKKRAEDIWLCVNEGQVEVKKNGSDELVIVNAGEGIAIASGKEISKPKLLPWTKKLNWSMEGDDLVNKVSIEEAYSDLLDQDYD